MRGKLSRLFGARLVGLLAFNEARALCAGSWLISSNPLLNRAYLQ